jgi:hypothetical protein
MTLQQLGVFLCLLIVSVSHPCPDESGPANKLPLLHVVDGDAVILDTTGMSTVADGPQQDTAVLQMQNTASKIAIGFAPRQRRCD